MNTHLPPALKAAIDFRFFSPEYQVSSTGPQLQRYLLRITTERGAPEAVCFADNGDSARLDTPAKTLGIQVFQYI